MIESIYYEVVEEVTMRTVLSVIVAISCLVVIVAVMLQESKQAGLGTLDGSGDSSWGSHTGTSRKQMLEKTTLIASIVMMVSIIAVAAL